MAGGRRGLRPGTAAVTGGMLALIEHPDRKATPRSIPQWLPVASEEMIRCTTPIQHFRRTATRDTQIRGQKFRADDKVVVWYSSGNRDESVFPGPFRFDL